MERYHPMINFIFFAMVLGYSMFLMHPLAVFISMAAGLAYALHLFGAARLVKGLPALFTVVILTAVMNPMFNHQGVTVLAYLPSGNLLTQESIFYGIEAGGRLAAALLWFRCMSEMMTSEKLVYLFGKGFPVLGLLLSMILGFIPKMQRKLGEIRTARNSLLWEENDEGKRQTGEAGKMVLQRCGMRKIYDKLIWKLICIRHGAENLSILVTWALEDAAQTADSMKCRGYGLIGRTAFTVYRFTRRDLKMLLLLLGEMVYLFAGIFLGTAYFEFYPQIVHSEWNIYTVSFFVVYAVFMLMPLAADYCEERRWNRLQSAI